MHRPGRIGRDVFDIDLGSLTPIALRRKRRPRAERCASASARPPASSVRLIKPGPATSTTAIKIVRAQFRSDQFGEVARFGLGFFRQHHRGIGRHIAMRGVARRLDHDPRKIDVRRPSTLRRERTHRRHVRAQARRRKDAAVRFIGHGRTVPGIGPRVGLGRRLTQIGGRVKKPLMFGQGEAVGHPGNEIADSPGPLGFGFRGTRIAAIPAGKSPGVF